MKDDSLYIIAIVAVVAVVGLVIMATGSSTTVVAQESLPDMVESDDSAIAGQAIARSSRASSPSRSAGYGRSTSGASDVNSQAGTPSLLTQSNVQLISDTLRSTEGEQRFCDLFGDTFGCSMQGEECVCPTDDDDSDDSDTSSGDSDGDDSDSDGDTDSDGFY